jgi:hypothetical protein
VQNRKYPVASSIIQSGFPTLKFRPDIPYQALLEHRISHASFQFRQSETLHPFTNRI